MHTYYMSEALLRMQFQEKRYTEVLEGAQIINDSESQTTCQIIQKTKALFLDSGADVAITYFKNELGKRQDKTDERRKFLASMYDEHFNIKGDKPMTMEQFEKRYYSSAAMTDRILQEAYAVSQLKRIFDNRDYEQIDLAMKLYSVLREERQMKGIEYMLDEKDLTVSKFAKSISDNDKQKLSNIRERKLFLIEQLNREDYDRLKEIVQIMNNDKLEVFDGLDSSLVERMLNMFESVAS